MREHRLKVMPLRTRPGTEARYPRPPTFDRRAPRIDVKFPILGFLMESEMTGYDLKRRFQEGVGFFYRTSDGSLYPALKKLAQDAMVTMRAESIGRRTRKVYAITPAGRAWFLKTLREPAQPLFVFDEALVKIYFAHHDPQAALDHMNRVAHEDAETVRILHELAHAMKRSGDSPYRRIVVELGAAMCAAKVEALARLIAQLKKNLALQHRVRAHVAEPAAAGR